MGVARRAAVEGYLALAPDALSCTGGTQSDQDQARSLIRELDRGGTQQDYLSSVGFAKNLNDSSGRVGCVGFVGDVGWQINWL